MHCSIFRTEHSTALQRLAANGIVHRDISNDNLFLSEGELEGILVDFDFAGLSHSPTDLEVTLLADGATETVLTPHSRSQPTGGKILVCHLLIRVLALTCFLHRGACILPLMTY